jgi:hypothetical protein
MMLGGPGVVMIGVGAVVFRYYWKKGGSNKVEHISGKKFSDVANCLIIYPDKVEFSYIINPEGYPWECLNDKTNYFIYIKDMGSSKLIPFILPDQQYFDPEVFGQRVLGLPSHKKIFRRRPKLLERLKPAFLVLGIGVVWLLILTTTGG